MNDLFKDLSDPTYLDGFIDFALQPFELAIYISFFALLVYSTGVFITALITTFVVWIFKENNCYKEFSVYWMWSWLGLCLLIYNEIFKKIFKRQ